MKRLTPLLLLAALIALPAHAQLPTSDLDGFDRPDSVNLGSTPTAPTDIQWSEKGEEVASDAMLPADSTVRIGGNELVLQSGAKDGQKWATVDMSNVSGYPTTLNDASGTVTWAFNMRQNRANPEGFSPGEHGLMFILASSGNNFPGSGNAYAVVLGQDGASDALKLVSFNGGYSAEEDFTEIATWSTNLATAYLSVRVTFNADNKTWTLYAEQGASSYPYDDPRNVSAERGAAQNSDMTGDGQKYLGALWNHGQDDTAKAYFDDIYVTDPSGNLPVELATFDATAQDDAVHLQWTTASETRNAGFRVQRATETGYETLGFVEGTGTTTASTRYTYTAEDLSPGRHTFRLMQVDLDGSTSPGGTRTVTVRPEGLHLTALSANPVQEAAAAFRLAAQSEMPVTVTLHDVLGRTVRTVFDGRTGPEGRRLSVPVRELSSGVYFVRVQGPSGTATRRITVTQ